jgi:hypothetical protein
MITEKIYLEAKKIVDTYESEQLNKPVVSSRFVYEPTGQGTLTNGTIIYNFDTKEEDVIVDYKNGRSSITANGRHFHVSANVLGGGWKAVRKTYC